jgi:hypothetical protein
MTNVLLLSCMTGTPADKLIEAGPVCPNPFVGFVVVTVALVRSTKGALLLIVTVLELSPASKLSTVSVPPFILRNDPFRVRELEPERVTRG